MRIAVVNSFFPPRVGGSAHLSSALAEGYARAGHEVVVISAAYRDAPEFEERDGIKIYRLPAATLPHFKRLSVSFDIAFTARRSVRGRVAAILDDFRPDVMHQHGQFFDLTWVTGMWARKHKVPVLLSVHTRLESPSIPYAIAFRIIDKGLVAPILRLYKPVFVVMDVHMDSYIRSRYRHGISGLEVIPVGVHPERLRTGNGDAVREKYDLGDRPVILSVGHVIPLRDRMALVEALPRIRKAVPDVRLVVVGNVYTDAYQQRARELKVEDLVVSTGAVPSIEIPDFLAAAAVESHDVQGYGLGTASLESMGAGVPVVAAVRRDNFPGVELISGRNCWLVPLENTGALADALVDAITHPDKRSEVGERGRELVLKHFTMDVVLERHLEVLSAIAGGL